MRTFRSFLARLLQAGGRSRPDPEREVRIVEAGLRTGRLERAESAARRLAALDPESPRARFLLAAVAARRGDLEALIVRLRDYVAAERAAGRPDRLGLTLPHLAGAASHVDIRGTIAAALREAGHGEAADRVELGLTGGTSIANPWCHPGAGSP